MEKIKIENGTIIRVSGQAGVGKTTFVLQLCNEIINTNNKYIFTIIDNELSIPLRRLADILDGDNYRNINLITSEIYIEKLCELLCTTNNNIILIDAIHLLNNRDMDCINKIKDNIKNTNNILILTSQLKRIIGKGTVQAQEIEAIDTDIIMNYISKGNIEISCSNGYNNIFKVNEDMMFNKEDIKNLLQ